MLHIAHKFYRETHRNKPHGFGLIDPLRFSPCPKNPSIARIFREIGRADELGSGVRNLFKYCRAYCGHNPQLIEENVFQFVLPLIPQVTMQAIMQAIMQVTMQVTMQAERTEKILAFCEIPRTREEIQEFVKIKNRDYFRRDVLNPLLEAGRLLPTMPDKLTSPLQKYYTAIYE